MKQVHGRALISALGILALSAGCRDLEVPSITGDHRLQHWDVVTRVSVEDLGLLELEPDAMAAVPDMDGDELQELVLAVGWCTRRRHDHADHDGVNGA